MQAQVARTMDTYVHYVSMDKFRVESHGVEQQHILLPVSLDRYKRNISRNRVNGFGILFRNVLYLCASLLQDAKIPRRRLCGQKWSIGPPSCITREESLKVNGPKKKSRKAEATKEIPMTESLHKYGPKLLACSEYRPVLQDLDLNRSRQLLTKGSRRLRILSAS